jgi:hypothetical protein
MIFPDSHSRSHSGAVDTQDSTEQPSWGKKVEFYGTKWNKKSA